MAPWPRRREQERETFGGSEAGGCGTGRTTAKKKGKSKLARVSEVMQKRRVAARRVMAEQEKHGAREWAPDALSKIPASTPCPAGTHVGERENATEARGRGNGVHGGRRCRV